MANKYITEYSQDSTPDSTDAILLDQGSGAYVYATIANVKAVSHADGTAASPSINFEGDTDTGFYLKANNQLGMAVGGVEQFYMDNNANAFFTGAIVLTDDNFIGIGSSTEKITFDATGTPGTIKIENANLSADNDVYSTAWTSFTPTLTSAGTVPTFTTTIAYYKKIGNTVHWTIYLDGDAGTDGSGANNLSIALPVNLSATGYATAQLPIGSGYIYYAGATRENVTCTMGSTVATMFMTNNADGVVVVDGDFANGGRRITLSGTYEAA